MDSQVTELLVDFTTRLTEWNEEVDDPERFFAVVQANAEAEAPELQSAFDQEGFGRAGEALITCVDDTGRPDLIGKVAGESLDELVPEFKQLDEAARSVGGVSEEAAGSSGEAELWQQAVEQFGPQWVNWDGTEETWGQYRDWFYQVTNAVNPDLYAVAYQNLDPLNADDPATRVAKLKDFGFDVSGTEVSAPESAAELFDEEKVAELHQEVSGIVDEVLPDGAAQYVTRERIDALITEFPEAASLDPDQLRAVIKDAWDLANA